jgi:hypothetical protein
MYLLNNYIKHNYPQKHTEFLIALSFNTIYMVSIFQIKFKKIIKYINQTNPRLLEFFNKYKNMKDVEFVLDGKVIYLTTRENIVNHIVDIDKKDFIIYSDYDTSTSNNDNCTNKKIMVSKEISTYEDFIYEVSDIKFMLCELVVGEKTYNITLKSDIENYNYYLVDNIINKKFLIYYLIEFYNEDFNKSTDKFILKLIDHNVNVCEIDMTNDSNYIRIKKDSYITN